MVAISFWSDRLGNNMNRVLLLLSLFVVACSPYSKGPVLSMDDAERSFKPLVELMEVQPGMSIADVGAGSGVLSVVMSTQLKGCTLYIQDIDKKVLTQKNLDKVLDHYSEKMGTDLRQRNDYRIVYGNVTSSNLPEREIDLIYSNATIHAFDNPDVMIRDLKTKLSGDGRIFIRDSFKEEGAGEVFCESKQCARPLLSISELMALMDDQGFELVDQIPDLSGYPVFGFAVRD